MQQGVSQQASRADAGGVPGVNHSPSNVRPGSFKRGWVSVAEFGGRWEQLQAASVSLLSARIDPPPAGKEPQDFWKTDATHLRLQLPGQGPSRGEVS